LIPSESTDSVAYGLLKFNAQRYEFGNTLFEVFFDFFGFSNVLNNCNGTDDLTLNPQEW